MALKHWLLPIFLFGFSLASACLWDYDTLSVEAKGMPDVLDAIVGRFERNPPLYYEMRLARVSKMIKAGDRSLSLFDDAAVACDRLGKGDEGLKWLAQKRALLDKNDPERTQFKEDWYRYFANVGTLRVHRWFREGAKEDRLPELEEAIDEIDEAIKINPDAHFGREWVQSGLMKAILAHKKGDDDGAHEAISKMFEDRSSEQVSKGLVGLVTLGAAWESPDVIALLGADWLRRNSQSIAVVASLRVKELEGLKKPSAFGDAMVSTLNWHPTSHSGAQSESELKMAYLALRENAEQFHNNRTDFMLARLRAGKHPDTDKDFWNGYVETPRPNLRKFEPLIPKSWMMTYGLPAVAVMCLLSIPVALLVIVFRRWKLNRHRPLLPRKRQ